MCDDVLLDPKHHKISLAHKLKYEYLKTPSFPPTNENRNAQTMTETDLTLWYSTIVEGFLQCLALQLTFTSRKVQPPKLDITPFWYCTTTRNKKDKPLRKISKETSVAWYQLVPLLITVMTKEKWETKNRQLAFKNMMQVGNTILPHHSNSIQVPSNTKTVMNAADSYHCTSHTLNR